MDREGRWLDLTIGGDANDARLDAIVAMQAKGVPRLLVTIATREGAAIVLSPIALIGDDDTLQSFDLWEPPRPVMQRRTVLDRLKEGVGALVSRQKAAAVFTPAWRGEAASPLVARAGDEALALAELGGRMEDAARLDLLARLAVELDGAGWRRLPPCCHAWRVHRRASVLCGFSPSFTPSPATPPWRRACRWSIACRRSRPGITRGERMFAPGLLSLGACPGSPEGARPRRGERHQSTGRSDIACRHASKIASPSAVKRAWAATVVRPASKFSRLRFSLPSIKARSAAVDPTSRAAFPGRRPCAPAHRSRGRCPRSGAGPCGAARRNARPDR